MGKGKDLYRQKRNENGKDVNIVAPTVVVDVSMPATPQAENCTLTPAEAIKAANAWGDAQAGRSNLRFRLGRSNPVVR